MPMREKQYSKGLGATAAISMRLIEASEYSGTLSSERQRAKEIRKREIIIGDSFFTSRRLCVALQEKFGHEYFGALKTNHSGTPKIQVGEIMKDWPGGGYLVLVCEELRLFFVGYKYNYRKNGELLFIKPSSAFLSSPLYSVCFFLGTWNSGSTVPGEPYYAKWPDKYGNLLQRPVQRPDVIGQYFDKSNIIDVGNGLRQNELALERHWLTYNPWFRIDCTVLGICVTDAYLAAKYQAPTIAGFDTMSIRDYAMHTVYDLWNYKHSAQPRSMIRSTSDAVEVILPVEAEGSPMRSSGTSLEYIMEEHPICYTAQRTGSARDGKGQLVRRMCQMRADGCKGQITTECGHRKCKRKQNSALNKWGTTQGTFICTNHSCKMKHWKAILEEHEDIDT